MPSVERASHLQTAILWEATGEFDDYGTPLISPNGDEISCRWENAKIDPLMIDGEMTDIDAEVFTDRAIPIGSNLWLGGFEDIPGSGTGTDQQPDADVMRVVRCDSIPDIKNRITEYEVFLKKLKDTLGPS